MRTESKSVKCREQQQQAFVVLGGKSFCKTPFQLGMGPKKGQKQGRDERMQEDYPTSAKNTQQM